MRKLTNRERIAKRDEEENTNQLKKKFFRRRAFVNPTMKSMKFDKYDTYAENKKDYYNVLSMTFAGKKDIMTVFAETR